MVCMRLIPTSKQIQLWKIMVQLSKILFDSIKKFQKRSNLIQYINEYIPNNRNAANYNTLTHEVCNTFYSLVKQSFSFDSSLLLNLTSYTMMYFTTLNVSHLANILHELQAGHMLLITWRQHLAGHFRTPSFQMPSSQTRSRSSARRPFLIRRRLSVKAIVAVIPSWPQTSSIWCLLSHIEFV